MCLQVHRHTRKNLEYPPGEIDEWQGCLAWKCNPLFAHLLLPFARLGQAGGLPAISRWLREERAPPPDSADRKPTIPEGWQRLPRSAAYPPMLASLRDAIDISIDRWYLPLCGINHRLIADKPPACPVGMTTESCVEQQGHRPGLVYPGLSGHRHMRQSLRLTRMRRGWRSSATETRISQ
jgi:hypothetical protein